MGWNTLISTVVLTVFILLMLRGCGGMMTGGGCGMGMRPRRRHSDEVDSHSVIRR